jgi:hypothetical protein
MRTWRTKAADLFRQWRITRDQRRMAKRVLQDRRAAEQLDRVRAGGDRFPPHGF